MTNLDDVYGVDDRVLAFQNHETGVLVSLAGPGTGKTYSLLRRMEALTGRGEGGDAICYLTFVRAISNAFIADYIDDFGADEYAANRPRISTLHSFACRLIRNQGFRIGYSGELYFMSITGRTDDSARIFLSDLLPLVSTKALGTPGQLRKALDQLKTAWRDCVDPLTLDATVAGVLPTCLDLLRAYRVVEWDQAVPVAHSLLGDLLQRPRWVSQIRHFLVDEYQDFNRAEQAFIDALAASAVSMVIVGDDDQSLYSGRGGSPDGLRELWISDEVDRVSLVKCYRCKSRIVVAANTFLGSMRPDPRLMTPNENGGQVSCLSFKSSKAEIAYLAAYLTQRIAELPEDARPKDGTVCLFPTRRALAFYYERLSADVRCTRRRPDTHELRLWLQRVLQLLCHPGQRFLERLLLERYNAIAPRHKREMVKLIVERDISPCDALSVIAAGGSLTGLGASQASDFCELCQTLELQDPGLVAQQISALLNCDVRRLTELLETFLLRVDEPEQEDRISSLCDELIPDSAEPPVDPRAVLFLTMHGAKGLTRKTVVMPGLEQAWLPGDATGDSLEEKQRLFYVALTRATDRVLVTYPRTRARGDPLNYPRPGRGRPCPFARRSGIRCSYHA